MANESIEIVHNLQQKVSKLVDRYRSVKTDNDHLKSENDQLALQLEESAREMAELKEKYNTLKFSKTIEAKSGDVHFAKIRINQIVREIDKCIALLNR
ncbi:cell division protein ZapB [Labilibacter marinus]|uniref:cell division protein ZapB n=1 Tax=Labilibacter marinus TaxID=1477105 RepID=UPI00094F91D1|nr:cell division protein ZapB [Labilibacter marinus]